MLSPSQQAALAALAAAYSESTHRTPRVLLGAFLAAPVRVGNIRLRQVTLSDWLMLEAVGHPRTDPKAVRTASATETAMAAFILSKTPAAVRTARAEQSFGAQVIEFAAAIPAAHLALIEQTVTDLLHRAFATIISPQFSPDADPFESMPDNDSGLGWALTLVNAICAEYAWTEQYVTDELPLARAFALLTAIKVAHNVPLHAPGYTEQEMLDKMETPDEPNP